jgi:hypothetical protein
MSAEISRESTATPDLGDDFWDNLVDYIDDRKVIPVIGPELVTVREDDRDVPLYCWIAQRLADDLKLPTAELPEGFDLNDVVSMHLRRKGDRNELYARINRILRKGELAPSESLRTLTEIPGFDLYTSLTFDSLLADAIRGAEQVSYSPKSVRDLARPRAGIRQPVVFHLLGLASASQDYAICDDDLLEFLHAMQDKQRQPKRLFDKLRDSHLLILGCSFGDWLARFFLRTVRNLELSQTRQRCDVLVGDQIANDAKLVQFLKSFSPDARVIPLSAPQFVTELAKRWHLAHPVALPNVETPIPKAGRGGRNVPDGVIFISYVRDDIEAASRLAEGLIAAGLEVWFDKDTLRGGDNWALSIRRGLERCSLFLPVISHQTLSVENGRRYFWREWNDADEHARGMSPDEAYIIPVRIDDTRFEDAPLDSFKRAQGLSLPDGKVTPDAAARLVELVRDFHRRQRAA